MRVPSLAALAVICAACADGNPSAITSPDPLFGMSGAAARRIARCELSPGSLTLKPGAAVSLTIDCYDSGGRFLGQPDTRHSNFASANPAVATVSNLGRVTARAIGTTIVRGWHPERPFNDSLVVTVTSTGTQPAPGPAPAPAPAPSPTPAPAPAPTPIPPPTGPPAPTAGFPNQPSGMILITDRHFDSKATDNDDKGPGGSDGWDGVEYRYGNFTIANDPSAPNGDGRVGQMFYSATMTAGTGPGIAQIYFPRGVRQVYLSIWARISPNWVGNQSSTNKMFFLGVAGGNNQFFLSAEGSGSNPLYAQLRLQGINDPRPRITANINNAEIIRGAWQRWELVVTCNSRTNAADGSINMWINGTHVTSVRDVNWTHTKYPTRPCDMNIFNWNPTYGGGGASPGVNQYLWFDRVYISGK